MGEPSQLKLRSQKPYVLLLEPTTGRAAAYNRQHQLTVPMASPALVRFALERGGLVEEWRDDKDHGPRVRPDWMPRGSLAGWCLIWLRDGKSTMQHLRETPDA